MRKNSRSAVRLRFAFGLLTLCLLCAPTPQAQTSNAGHQQVQKLVEANSRALEAGVEADLGLCRAWLSRKQELGAAAGAVEGGGVRGAGGVADEPTAFIASYGEGKPVVAILGEFDALPGLSQQTVPAAIR